MNHAGRFALVVALDRIESERRWADAERRKRAAHVSAGEGPVSTPRRRVTLGALARRIVARMARSLT